MLASLALLALGIAALYFGAECFIKGSAGIAIQLGVTPLLDESAISQAIGYARNQRVALRRFLDDGRLPIDNDISELNLRRQVLGRRNWLFVGSDDGALVNTVFASLLASCRLHDIEPLGYLRDLLCLLPSWPRNRILELAPAYW